MLFYYFKSKKELFNYLIEYALDFIQREYLDLLDENEPDFLKRYEKAVRLKMEKYIKNRYVFIFLFNIMQSEALEIKEKYEKELEKTQKEGFKKLYSNIDTSYFREDIEAEKIYKLITYALEGFQNKVLESVKGKDLTSFDFTPFWDEFYELVDVLRKTLYKDEEVCDENDRG